MESQVKEKISELETKLKSVHAKSIMTKNVITTTPFAHLSDLANQLIKARVSGLPVVDKKGKVVGIVTTTDLFIVMGMVLEGTPVGIANMETIDPTVDFAMSTDVISIHKDTTLEEMVKLMRDKNIHTIPVMEGEKLIGVIGRRDVLKKFYEVVKNL